MTEEFEKALDNLASVLRKECRGSNVASVEIMYNAQGCEYTFVRKDRDALKRNSISIRNICGQWIE